jgi:hypothetical protein
MAVREIVLDAAEPHFTTQVALDGVSWSLEFEWMEAPGAWFFTLYDAAGRAVVAGRRVVMDWPLTMRYRARNAPLGNLVFRDRSGGSAPGRAELGQRCKLYYVDAAGVDA